MRDLEATYTIQACITQRWHKKWVFQYRKIPLHYKIPLSKPNFSWATRGETKSLVGNWWALPTSFQKKLKIPPLFTPPTRSRECTKNSTHAHNPTVGNTLLRAEDPRHDLWVAIHSFFAGPFRASGSLFVSSHHPVVWSSLPLPLTLPTYIFMWAACGAGGSTRGWPPHVL